MVAKGPDKTAMRAAVIAARDRLDGPRRSQAGDAITAGLLRLPAQVGARTLLSYASFGTEFDTRAFNEHVLASGRSLLLPRVDRAIRRLRLYAVASLADDLLPGVWGILEPDPARCREASIEEVDFILVPGVAFDESGGRLGYGGGFYDRLLARVRPDIPRVAGAFSLQVVAAVPVEDHDCRVTTLVTENATIAIR
jgi:5,10-methenyltetrahydrofolate synthetase